MATITLKGNEIKTSGELPTVGSEAPAFTLTKSDLSEVALEEFKGKKVILNIFPSIDTSTCATSVRKFNEKAAALENSVVLCISKDLPFAQQRFCGAEGIENVVTLSDFRHPEFATNYGLKIETGPLSGLDARSVVVIDESGKVTYTELVKETADEPDYEAALAAL
ncbi:thiol peroxidase [Fulvivirga maritima]|uniref:thiol peroxidase n=1 Tax=Fulvivirga maritima TaxID=2904247 RepID=UPI001F437D59|nr:thiol peroxidase [Fulvivirga maritima]UII28359.1 thiol peroxidase [Fulvivirga maritima]